MTATTAPAAAPRLRVMVCPHELAVGGSQINAIDLAAALRDRGHEVEIFAPVGPLVERIQLLSVPFVRAPARRRGFDMRTARAMSAEIRRFRPDVVHAFESYPTVASSLVALLRPHTLVVTVMSMSVPDYIPQLVPLTAGTGELVAGASRRAGPTVLLEPPIDVDADAPRDPAAARATLGVEAEELAVAVVGRLSSEHQKARGIVAAIADLLAAPPPRRVVLLIAGAGDEEESVRRAAARSAGTTLRVVLLGHVPDPRTVYDAADIVFGMGGSALRAMAHAKPLIVQGRDGFWDLLTPESLPRFFATGFFGAGESGGPGFGALVAALADDAPRRAVLGSFGRDVVMERYAITRAATQLEAIYRAGMEAVPTRRSVVADRVRSLGRFGRFSLATSFPALQLASRRMTGRDV